MQYSQLKVIQEIKAGFDQQGFCKIYFSGIKRYLELYLRTPPPTRHITINYIERSHRLDIIVHIFKMSSIV